MPLQEGARVGEVRYWAAGNACWTIVDADDQRLRVAIVGREPSRPLVGFAWIKAWMWPECQ